MTGVVRTLVAIIARIALVIMPDDGVSALPIRAVAVSTDVAVVTVHAVRALESGHSVDLRIWPGVRDRGIALHVSALDEDVGLTSRAVRRLVVAPNGVGERYDHRDHHFQEFHDYPLEWSVIQIYQKTINKSRDEGWNSKNRSVWVRGIPIDNNSKLW